MTDKKILYKIKNHLLIEMDAADIIKFSGSRNTKTGYLSNESAYSFKLKHKMWPTVEHYVQAQKFVGTHYEEEIRKAKTVHQVKLLVKQKHILVEKNDKLVKEKVYGKNKNYRIRKDWAVQYPKILAKAMNAKFKQNSSLQERLLDTAESTLEDTKNPKVGPILEKIRDSLQAVTPEIDQQVDFYQKVKSGTMSKVEKDFIKAIVILSNEISKSEGCDGVIHPGMIEDALYSLIRKKSLILDLYAESQEMSWNIVYTDMPNFKKIVDNIIKSFEGKLKSPKQSGMTLAFIIRDLRGVTDDSNEILILKNKRVLGGDRRIRMLKKHRTYRNCIPPKRSRLYRDTNPDLTQIDKDFVKVLVILSSKISKLEGWNGDIYSGMVEDALYSLFQNKSGWFKKYASGQKISWTKMNKEMPNFKKIVDYVNIAFKGKLRSTSISMGIAYIMSYTKSHGRYIEILRSKIKRVLDGDHKIKLLKKTRTYRKGKAPKIPRATLLTPKEKAFIEKSLKKIGDIDFLDALLEIAELLEGVKMNDAASKKDFYAYIDQVLVSMGNKSSTDVEEAAARAKKYIEKERKKAQKKAVTKEKTQRIVAQSETMIIIKEASGNIMVKGKPVEAHAHELLMMGGRHPMKARKPDKTRVRFSSYMKQEVENYIFKMYPESKKWVIGKQLWQANKYLTILDTAIQVSKHLKSIDIGTIKFTLNQIYGCTVVSKKVSKEVAGCVKQMVKKPIDSDALEFLVGYITSIEKKLKKPHEGLDRKEYTESLDEMIGWGSTDGSVNILKALQNIADLLTGGLPVETQNCLDAFMVLIPNSRKGAKQYIDGVICDLGDMTIAKVAEKYELGHVTTECMAIFSAATKYINGMIKRNPRLKNRIRLMSGNQNEACQTYKKGDFQGNNRAIIFDDMLYPLNLDDSEYDEIIERWNSLKITDIVKEFNKLENISPEDRKSNLI